MKSHELLPFDICGSRMKIAAALITTAVVGVAGAGASAYEANSASNAQTSAANNAAALQQSQYNQTLQNQQPYMQAGTSALNTITQDQANGTGFAAPFNPSNYIDTPGYQFQTQAGTDAINASAAATSGVLNGGTLKALDQYTTGLANTTYGTAYNQYLANSQQQYNQLYGVASLGENATASTGAAGAAAANASGSYLTQAGNAQAAGAIGTGNAINSGMSSIANAGNMYALTQGMSSSSSYGKVPSNLTTSAGPNYGVD